MKSVNNVDDLKNEGGEWVMSYNPEKNVNHVTVSGKLWLGINDRCKHGGKKHILQPSYVGCENHFESFQELPSGAKLRLVTTLLMKNYVDSIWTKTCW